MAAAQPGLIQAQDVMTTAVITIAASATVKEAAKRMLQRRISALPVVGVNDRVIGMVSEGDLMRRVEIGTDAPRSWWLRLLGEDAARDYMRMHGRYVRDVMASPVVSVRRKTPLKEVAQLLEKHQIKRVPVLEGARLIGIVSRADLVRRFATAPERPAARTSSDRALRGFVLERVARSRVDATYVNITVEHRTVHLWGSMRSNGERRVLRVAAESVEGVRKVEDHTKVMPMRVAANVGRRNGRGVI
jgi:CBS domain-containing protein